MVIQRAIIINATNLNGTVVTQSDKLLHEVGQIADHRADDKIMEFDGVKFFIDPKSAIYLNGTQLDFSDGLTGTGFNFVNPNAQRTCGCGSSFSV